MRPFGGRFDACAASHLLRRAAFAPAPGQAAAAADAGLGETIDRLIDAPLPPPTAIERALGSGAEHEALAAAVLHRLVSSTAPLRENLALFFHNHFVSALGKVRDGRMMLAQVALFRELGLGRFADLAKAVARDPAMVRYLDLERSTRASPNENFARELFELFTMGPGHYTETDIREAARALTGCQVRGGRFFLSEAARDPGSKTVLGKSGDLSADDVVGAAADHPATAGFMARKLARHFVADEPSDAVVGEIAASWRKHRGDMRAVLRELLASEAFFAAEHRHAVTRSPAALVAAIARGLGCVMAPLDAARHCFAMGQALLDPPSVKGYPGGAKWLNAATLLARRAFVLAALADGRRAPAPATEAAVFELVVGRRAEPGEIDGIVRAAAAAARPEAPGEAFLQVAVLHPLCQRC